MEDFTPSARIIADSISPGGHRLTTVEVRLHRFVLAELNTHRMLSRNSASSRAMPVHRTLAALADEPVYPLVWAGARHGMQGGDPLAAPAADKAREVWQAARDAAVDAAHRLLDLGVHKSVANRLLEPFMATTVIVSATAWDNFFAARCSPLAQPELAAAAHAVRDALHAATPTHVPYGGWHTPYLTAAEAGLTDDERCRIAVARCARVSYLTHDGRRDPAADLALYQRLVTAAPPHASPLEHVATPCLPGAHVPGNYTGWWQLRHLVLER